MSVVVAIKENGKVYIGADSQVTKGGTRTTTNGDIVFDFDYRLILTNHIELIAISEQEA